MDAFKKGANLSAVRMLFTYLRKERDGRLKEWINAAGDKQNKYIGRDVFGTAAEGFS